jgi:hypothetical protein
VLCLVAVPGVWLWRPQLRRVDVDATALPHVG